MGLFYVNNITAGLAVLNDNLEAEINECYLMHGTSREHVKSIEMQGVDARFAGEEPMFGRGAYYAESSTKADQYAGKFQILNLMFFTLVRFLFYSSPSI